MGSQRVGHDWVTSVQLWPLVSTWADRINMFQMENWHQSANEAQRLTNHQGQVSLLLKYHPHPLPHLYTPRSSPAAAKSLQSCPTLCDSIDSSLPGSPIPGILQARTLEWVAISFSNAWKWKVKVNLLSRVQLFVTPWTTAYQAPLPMGFYKQEYWSGVPCSSPNPSI